MVKRYLFIILLFSLFVISSCQTSKEDLLEDQQDSRTQKIGITSEETENIGQKTNEQETTRYQVTTRDALELSRAFQQSVQRHLSQ